MPSDRHAVIWPTRLRCIPTANIWRLPAGTISKSRSGTPKPAWPRVKSAARDDAFGRPPSRPIGVFSASAGSATPIPMDSTTGGQGHGASSTSSSVIGQPRPNDSNRCRRWRPSTDGRLSPTRQTPICGTFSTERSKTSICGSIASSTPCRAATRFFVPRTTSRRGWPWGIVGASVSSNFGRRARSGCESWWAMPTT